MAGSPFLPARGEPHRSSGPPDRRHPGQLDPRRPGFRDRLLGRARSRPRIPGRGLAPRHLGALRTGRPEPDLRLARALLVRQRSGAHLGAGPVPRHVLRPRGRGRGRDLPRRDGVACPPHGALRGPLGRRGRPHHRLGDLLPDPEHLPVLRPSLARAEPHLRDLGGHAALCPARRRRRALRPALRGRAPHPRCPSRNGGWQPVDPRPVRVAYRGWRRRASKLKDVTPSRPETTRWYH